MPKDAYGHEAERAEGSHFHIWHISEVPDAAAVGCLSFQNGLGHERELAALIRAKMSKDSGFELNGLLGVTRTIDQVEM
jgi:hypothetical protein